MGAIPDTMAYVGETPWHSLGNKVHNGMTVTEFREAAGVSWDVYMSDLYTKRNGKYVKSKRKAVCRTDTHVELTWIPEKGWHPVSNEHAFEFFRDWVEEGGLELHTAGSLFGGQQVWVLAKAKESFSLFKKDVVDSYLLFSLPHQYGQGTSVRSTMTRVVCENTLTAALAGKADLKVSINHRREFDREEVKKALMASKMRLEQYKEAATLIANKRWNEETLENYFGLVFPKTSLKIEANNDKASRNAVAAMVVMDTQPGAEMGAGTWWQAFNACTYTVDHLMGNKPEAALKSMWWGANAARKRFALDKAVEFAQAA